MFLPRRLYHCSRCLYSESPKGITLPPPSQPEPIVHPKSPPSLLTPRVSLSPNSIRKIPKTDWNRNAKSNEALPFVSDKKIEANKAAHNAYRQGFLSEKTGDRLKSEQSSYPPIPAPRTAWS
jgi:hypothetical protein